ncbi:MAG: GerAB/ArcD/ProY family transporter [Thermoanaerobacterales bacterium]|nr:GerAB/ArcD/ProY family transporter [Thermoanaerobacterales bacterium]
MAREPRLGVQEAVTVTVIFLIAKLFLSHQIILYHVGTTAAWLLPVLHTLVALVIFLALAWVLDHFPGRTIIEAGEALLGPYVNMAVSVLFLMIILLLTGLNLRQFSEWLLTGFLPDTPIGVVVFFYVAAIVVVVYLGFDTIARVARVYSLFLGLGLALLFAMTTPYWSIQNIMPLGGSGPGRLLSGGLVTSGVVAEIFLLFFLTPFIPRGALRTIGFWSIGLAGCVLTLGVLIVSLCFPYPVTSELSLPVFELSRLVLLGRFLQRAEALFLPMWVMMALVQLAVALWAVTAVLSRSLRLPCSKVFILPAAVLVTAVSFYPVNVASAIELDNGFLRLWSMPAIGLITLVLTLATWWRNRKGGLPRDDAQNP